jgi:four helix bundle protein
MLYKSHEELPVFQFSHKITLIIYRLTAKFPNSELYGIISQLRRATSSIPANIVEGFYRSTKKDLIRFLIIARGSCGESRYFLLLAKDLGYLSMEQYKVIDEDFKNLHKQINGWIRSMNA